MMTSARYKHPLTLRLSFFLATLTCLLTPGESLKCYTCSNARDNEECSGPNNLVDCNDHSPPAIEYDTCQTKLTNTDEDGVLITKKCAQGPCSLGDDQSAALGMECDRSTPSWSCMLCCKEDGCNINTAAPFAMSSYILLGVTTAGLLVRHLVF